MKAKPTTWMGPFSGVILFCAAIWILHHELAVHHLKDILQHIRSLPAERIVAALLLAAAGYGVMTTYDLLALRYSHSGGDDETLIRAIVTQAGH